VHASSVGSALLILPIIVTHSSVTDNNLAHTETATRTITSEFTTTTTAIQAPSTVFETKTLPASTVTSLSTAPGMRCS